MDKTDGQVKSELKLLPFMLGKLLGGFVTVFGFTAAVVIVTRKPGLPFAYLPLSLLLGVSGVAIFLLSSRLLEKRRSANKAEALVPDRRKSTSILSWAILLLLAAIFLLCSYFMTR
jgi:hypothetical protein